MRHLIYKVLPSTRAVLGTCGNSEHGQLAMESVHSHAGMRMPTDSSPGAEQLLLCSSAPEGQGRLADQSMDDCKCLAMQGRLLGIRCRARALW